MLSAPNRSPAEYSNAATSCGKLLLVDDNLGDLKSYSAVLRKEGYDVQSVAGFEEGVAWLDHNQFDLVIVSQGSCRFEGRAVLARALEWDRHMPVLVITTSADMAAYIDAMQMGAFDYVEKPLAPSELLELVVKHLRPREPSAVA